MTIGEVLQGYAGMEQRIVVGLMSGTSVDGIDAALVRISGSGRKTRAELLAYHLHPFPDDLRNAVLRLSRGEGNAESVSRTGVALGHLFADAVQALLQKAGFAAENVHLIASHGQTVSHTPLQAGTNTPGDGSTLQIGEAAVISERFRVPVISDFRVADMAAGGQGAPLVPFADWCLLAHTTKTRAVQNIGGIGNVTYLPADARSEDVIGFDTGPGNMVIDKAVQYFTGRRFDEDGKLASQGSIRTDILEGLLNHAFFQQPPPRSAGREQFGDSFFSSLLFEQSSTAPWLLSEYLPDAVATLTALTAYSIADAYERFLPRMPDEVIVGGGGARNPFLMDLLRERLAPIAVRTHEEIGIDSDAKEAIAFAILANETMLGNPSNLPSVTGATRPVVQGKIAFP